MMTRSKQSLALICGLVAAAGSAAYAAAPKALAGVAGGWWEIEGIPGTKTAQKKCVADPLKLALVEHQQAKCTETVLGEQGSTVRISFQCGAAGFGQASIKHITPRALRVEVSGIADGAPYGYVMQARRVGDCPTGAERGH